VSRCSPVGRLAGWPVVVDATFLRRVRRAQFAALAATLGVPFSILDCQAAMQVLRERLAQREASGGDASEADLRVLERLRGLDEPLDERERSDVITVDAAQLPRPEMLAQRWLAAVPSS